jgi:hypothetical protein
MCLDSRFPQINLISLFAPHLCKLTDGVTIATSLACVLSKITMSLRKCLILLRGMMAAFPLYYPPTTMHPLCLIRTPDYAMKTPSPRADKFEVRRSNLGCFPRTFEPKFSWTSNDFADIWAGNFDLRRVADIRKCGLGHEKTHAWPGSS